MKNSVFLALIILTALLASSCLSFNYYYSDDDPPSPSGVGVILYETKDEADKKEDVMRLVEAMIAGGVDLSPEEMVDAAFIMVNKINDRINNE